MKYAPEEVLQYVKEEDVKFIRLAFSDVFGKQKNIAILSGELNRAFEFGVAIDASAIDGFGGEVRSDLLLHPDPSTLMQLPWRPEQGKVARMFCDITYPDGTPFEGDSRHVLKKAVDAAKHAGYTFAFGTEMEFYLFKLDECGDPTGTPYDRAGYMDIAPEDRGENVRRQICLTLEQMGIYPESSHHESGPGQNEIDFRYSDPLTAADNAVTFRAVVAAIAAQNGLYADFSPKPIPDRDGSGMHINISAKGNAPADLLPPIIAGILKRAADMTIILNPCENSYDRLGNDKAPGYITWSGENRSQLIRIPAAVGEFRRAELRSPDSMANPYLAFALIIYAGMEGIDGRLTPPPAVDVNMFNAPADVLANYGKLPTSLHEARAIAESSAFLREHLSDSIVSAYCKNRG